MKTRPVGVELNHADGRTDRHDEAFQNFAKALENRGHFQYDLWTLGCLIFRYTLNI
jgi:hypothetical protein